MRYINNPSFAKSMKEMNERLQKFHRENIIKQVRSIESARNIIINI